MQFRHVYDPYLKKPDQKLNLKQMRKREEWGKKEKKKKKGFPYNFKNDVSKNWKTKLQIILEDREKQTNKKPGPGDAQKKRRRNSPNLSQL